MSIHQSTMGDAAATNLTSTGVTLIAKWGKERITLEGLNVETTIGNVKDLLSERTGVLQKRQKLIGISAKGGAKINDDLILGDLKVKNGKSKDASEGIVHQFIMMGTKEEQIFVDPGEKDDLPDVVDDFDLDFNAGSSEVRIRQATRIPRLVRSDHFFL
jgi:ubiquitin-like domain-containing CTD phosphatase 1